MGKNSNKHSKGKNSAKGIEGNLSTKSTRISKINEITGISCRTRSKRSFESVEENSSESQQPRSKVSKTVSNVSGPQSSNLILSEEGRSIAEDANNNATVSGGKLSSDQVGHIVGSTKSLIQSIKARNKENSAKNTKVVNEPVPGPSGSAKKQGKNVSSKSVHKCKKARTPVHTPIQGSKFIGTTKQVQCPSTFNTKRGKTILKSPSDVTLYTPALRRDATVASSPTLNNLARRKMNSVSHQRYVDGHDLGSTIDQISNLVERIRVGRRTSRDRTRSRSRVRSPNRLERDDRRRTRSRSRSVSVEPQHRDEQLDYDRRSATPARSIRPEVEEGRRMADKLILDAERFKASVLPPKGNDNNDVRYLEDDDEFFHLTCHIDTTLKKRIAGGEFVDLDRLLPKSRTQIMRDDQPLQQFINKNGATYWAPPDRDSRITNVRRWEQAFRIYAAIYSRANPNRAVEIWQYVYVINTAAASFAWENVYYYDVTFRQLMAERPERSWGKTYNQLWNLAMCDHLPKSNNFVPASRGGESSGQTNWKDRCCWRYNKGNKCKKWNCRYDHRCNNCGSWSHSKNVCSKLKGGDNTRYASPNRSQKAKTHNRRK